MTIGYADTFYIDSGNATCDASYTITDTDAPSFGTWVDDYKIITGTDTHVDTGGDIMWKPGEGGAIRMDSDRFEIPLAGLADLAAKLAPLMDVGKAVITCKWCGQWGARFCACKHCGAPIE